MILKQRILFITNFFPTYRKSIWERLSSSDNIEIKFFFDPIQNDGINVEDVFSQKEYSFNNIRNYYFFGIVIWQSNVIKECFFTPFNKVIFLGDMNILSTWICVLICKFRKKKTLFWTHGFYGNENFIKHSIRVLFYSIANSFLVYEQRGKELMVKSGFDPSRIFVVYNSLNYDLQKKYFETYQKTNHKKSFTFFEEPELKTILFLGRLTSIKKVNLLIESLKSLNSTKIKYNLLIIGEGPQKTILEKLSKKGIELGWIHFYGKTYDESELSDLIYSSDLMISPGNTGLNSVHALSYGTPVGTHNNFEKQMPEAAIIENKKTGFFFKENDSSDLSLKIDMWFSKFYRSLTRAEIRGIIDKKYNPDFQIKVIQRALQD